MDFLVDRTYQREIKPVPTLSCGGAFRYRSGERLHGMQEVSGSIPLFSTNQEQNEHEVTIQMVGNVFVLFCELPCVTTS